MAEFPALPIWTDALLGDTVHLSSSEFGAYMLLLIVAWRTRECGLKNDDAYLSRICRMDKREWARSGEMLKSFFFIGEDGLLHQKKLDFVRKSVNGKVLQKREAGLASALKRQQLTSTDVAPPLQRTANGEATNQNQNQNQTKEFSTDPLSLKENIVSFKQNKKNGLPKKQTELPDGWKPNDGHRDKAKSSHLDLDAEAYKFKNHHEAKGTTFVNWDAAFRTWLTKADGFKNQRETPNKPHDCGMVGGKSQTKPLSFFP